MIYSKKIINYCAQTVIQLKHMKNVKPCRIQRKRTKNFNLQKTSLSINGLSVIYVGRGTKWGNHARVGFYDTHAGYIENNADAVKAFELFMQRNPELVDYAIIELAGKNLACWCRLDQCCHADVLLDLANES